MYKKYQKRLLLPARLELRCCTQSCKLSGPLTTYSWHAQRQMKIIWTERNCNHAGNCFVLKQMLKQRHILGAFHLTCFQNVFCFLLLEHSWKNSEGCCIPTDQQEHSISHWTFSQRHDTPLCLFLYVSFISFICQCLQCYSFYYSIFKLQQFGLLRCA